MYVSDDIMGWAGCCQNAVVVVDKEGEGWGRERVPATACLPYGTFNGHFLRGYAETHR